MTTKILAAAPMEPPKASSWNDLTMRLRNPVTDFPEKKKLSATLSIAEPLPISKGKAKSVALGLTYGLFSGLFFSLCAASVKYLSDIDPGQVACFQYVAITVFSLPMVVRGGHGLLGPHPNTRWWFLLCAFFDAVTVYMSFISFRYLPLSDATVLTSSVPVFVTIAARIFLKEKCSTFQVLAIAISVAGVALVSKLPLLMASRSGEEVYTRESAIGLLASLGSVVTEGGVYIVLRKLHDVDVFVILFNFGVVATAINALLTVAFGGFTFTSCGTQQWLVFAVGVFSFLSQLSLTKALEIEEAGPVSVLMAAGDIVLAFVLDMTLFQDTPDAYTVGGTVLVVSSVMLVGFKNYLETHLKAPSLKRKFIKIFF